MMSGSHRTRAAPGVLVLWLSLLACASGIAVREFVLTPAGGDAGRAAPRDLSIGVGPVTLPRYLRRTDIATRVGPNEIHYQEANRWGESLDTGLARVVAENLAAQVPASRVGTFPWRGVVDVDYRVVIEVESFEAASDGSVVLAARWVVHHKASGESDSGRSSIARESEGKDTASKVRAMSRAAEELSREIAAVIRSRAGLASR